MYFDLTKGNLSFIGKTRHHQDFHLNDAWFMFSNPVRQMPYISNFRGLLFYGHLSKPGAPLSSLTEFAPPQRRKKNPIRYSRRRVRRE